MSKTKAHGTHTANGPHRANGHAQPGTAPQPGVVNEAGVAEDTKSKTEQNIDAIHAKGHVTKKDAVWMSLGVISDSVKELVKPRVANITISAMREVRRLAEFENAHKDMLNETGDIVLG